MTGYNVFCEGRNKSDIMLAGSNSAWGELSDEEKGKWNAKAAHRRDLAANQATPLETYVEQVECKEPPAGPWTLSSKSGLFALHTSAVEEVLRGTTMKAVADKWNARHLAAVMPDPSFPDTVPFDGPVLYDTPAIISENVKVMLETLRLELRYCSKQKHAGVVMEFRHAADRMYCYVPHSMKVDRTEFEAEMLSMVPATQDAIADPNRLPLPLVFMKNPLATKHPWPAIESETQFVERRCGHANAIWEVFELSSTTLGMTGRLVHERRAVDPDRLHALDAERREQQVVMKLMRATAGLTKHRQPGKPQRRGGRGRGRGRGAGRGAEEGAAASSSKDGVHPPDNPDKERQLQKTKLRQCDASSDSECETETDSELDRDPYKCDEASGPAAPAPSAPSPCPAAQPEVAGAEAAPAPDRAAPPAGIHRSNHRARPGEQIVEWWDDRFPFCRIRRNGEFTGWGVTCARHVNLDGTHAHTHCKKSLQAGASGLDEREAKLRLKRWLMAGRFHTFDAQCERASHVRIGGTHLADLGSHVHGWSDLNDDLDALLKTC